MVFRYRIQDTQFQRPLRVEFLCLAQHGVKRCGCLRPPAVRHDHGADSRDYSQGYFRELHPRVAHRNEPVAAYRQLQAATQRHAVQRGDDGFLHAVEMVEHP